MAEEADCGLLLDVNNRLLEALVGGASVGEALDTLEAPQRARRDELEHRARLWLGQWADAGFFLSVAAA